MKIFKNQKGFTLIEILASLAISGVLILGLVASVFQTIRVSESASPQITGLEDIRYTARSIINDIRTAESTDLVDDPEADPVNTLHLEWTDWTDTQPYRHTCDYSLVGTRVYRERYGWIDKDLDWVKDTEETEIPIDELEFYGTSISNIEFSLAGDIVTITITSAPAGNAEMAQSKTYQLSLSSMEDPVR